MRNLGNLYMLCTLVALLFILDMFFLLFLSTFLQLLCRQAQSKLTKAWHRIHTTLPKLNCCCHRHMYIKGHSFATYNTTM